MTRLIEPRATVKAGAAGRPQAGPSERWIRQNALLDQALEETFPASDPVSVALVE